MVKLCIDCGSEFETKTGQSVRCKPCRDRVALAKREATNLARRGVKNVMELPEMIDKITHTFETKYNGAKRAIHVPEFRQKMINTNIQNHGSEFYVNSEEFAALQTKRVSEINKAFAKLLDAHKIAYQKEGRVYTKAFDFFLPEYNTMIDIDPSYTHSLLPNHMDHNGKPANYHSDKTMLGEDLGYKCIHVFDWDSWDDILHWVCHRCNSLDDMSIVKENALLVQCEGHTILSAEQQESVIKINNVILDDDQGPAVIAWFIEQMLTDNRTIRLNISIDRNKIPLHFIRSSQLKYIGTCPEIVWSHGKERKYAYNENDEASLIEANWVPISTAGIGVYSEYQIDIETMNVAKERWIELYRTHKRDTIVTKMCPFCGLPFVPNSNKQRYCKRKHYMRCPVCNKLYEVTNNENLKRLPVACSYECRVKRTQATSIEKYGCKAPGNNPEAREKAKATSIRNRGVPYAMQSKEVRDKSRDTLMREYGVDNYAKIRYQKEEIDVDVISELAAARNVGQCYVISAKPEKMQDCRYYNTLVFQLNRLIPKNYVIVYPWEDIDKICEMIKSNQYIHADECQVYRLTKEITEEFLRENDYQPVPKGQVLCLGLVKDDQIIQVMTFGKVRSTSEHYVELLRVCTKRGLKVIDGLNRLSDSASVEFGVYNIVTYIDSAKPAILYDLGQLGLTKLGPADARMIRWNGKKLFTCSRTVYSFQ